MATWQVVAKANLISPFVCECSERTTGDVGDGRANERWRRLILLVKNWILAANSISMWQEDEMSGVSCDESAEPLVGR
ncbi:MAG: hypothetical protein KDD35_04055 [Bdellovibrionales bacterium]|nr:hypothetical protein [Bdellovibrionales bacterium]